ncbi:MAG: hypothetical protein ACQGVC_02620 [Myxococcota bacterium]
MVEMGATRPGLVDIAREFLGAHHLMRRLFERYRRGELRFEALQELIGDDARSLLFRLKERCHERFRSHGPEGGVAHRDALFDLAVGSLFHEAMKFRENFYQREVYAPRVEALRSEADPEEALLFEEFTRIQDGVSERLEEGLAETEALLARTLDQLCHLLVAHRDDPLVARFLVENDGDVESATGRPVSSLLEQMYGRAARGYEIAGWSLLESGYYGEAIDALAAAGDHGGDANGIASGLAYARGMQAYLAQDYAESVARLSDWVDAAESPAPRLAGLAHDAVSRIATLAEGDDRERVAADAGALLGRLPGPA